jgi:Domain of unknown function (DUF1887)
MSTMIALIGEQPLPNLLPVRHYHPQNVLLVYTERTKQVYERLKATLQQETTVYGLETDAFDIVAIAEALDKQLEQLPELNFQPVDFNLTGGTKAMALAAYQVAQQHNMPVFYLQSEGKHNRIYHYTWASGQLRTARNILLPECVALRDIFNVHFGPNAWQESGPGRAEGSPFEILLAETLQSQGYEIMIGVRALDGQIDIDVAMRFENRYGIIEAKMGKNGKKLDGIKQLSNNVRHVGTYTQTFFAVTVPPEPAHEAVTLASRIKVISLTSYDSKTNSLASDDLKKLITIVEASLK